jgi:hypothetical protein
LAELRKLAKTDDRTGVYKKSCEMNQSAFSKLMTHPHLTPAGQKVLSWFILHLGNKNFVGASYPQIAKGAKISVASVRRGCAALEEVSGMNFMVRVSKETRSSLWLVNPEYLWKGSRGEQAAGKAMYGTYQRTAANDANAKKKTKVKSPEINESPENYDTIPTDFSYSCFDESSDDEETPPCELKSKAA